MCLICYETVAIFKEFNIKRHYECKHQNKYVNCEGNLRTSLLEKFKQNFKSERVGNVFEKYNRGKDEIIRASYEVANLIARENKSFSDGEFVKKCILASVKEIIPEKMSVFENISLSGNTITRRLWMKAPSDTAQLLIFIRGIDTDYNITEELASLESISGTTKEADNFEKVNCCIENLGLTWEKLCVITTDGAPSWLGEIRD
ncbi:hypothetical protein QTP88_028353 [Uroleucon formosanum]